MHFKKIILLILVAGVLEPQVAQATNTFRGSCRKVLKKLDERLQDSEESLLTQAYNKLPSLQTTLKVTALGAMGYIIYLQLRARPQGGHGAIHDLNLFLSINYFLQMALH